MKLIDRLQTAIFRMLSPNSEAAWRGRIDGQLRKASELYSEGSFQEALDSLDKLVRNTEGLPGPVHAKCLEKVADFFNSVGQYSRAEPRYEQALVLQEKLAGSDSDGLAGLLNELALLYYAEGKFAEAEQLFERLLKILEKHRSPDDKEIAICLENYAAVQRKLMRSESSEKMRERARQIWQLHREAKS